jgi:hypothetical protein
LRVDRWFRRRDGPRTPQIETIVDSGAGFAIVQKDGRVAEDTDPRA